MHRWENLGEYYKRLHGNKTASILDIAFLNPEYDSMERENVLSLTKANDKQRRFLADVLDIDWLVIDNSGWPGLVEEKTVSITGKQFQRGKAIYITHGTQTQFSNLITAHKLGLYSYILLRGVLYQKGKDGHDLSLAYSTEIEEAIIWEQSNYYPVEKLSQTSSGKTKIVADDFIQRLRNRGSTLDNH